MVFICLKKHLFFTMENSKHLNTITHSYVSTGFMPILPHHTFSLLSITLKFHVILSLNISIWISKR
jgi:tRNA pseudouridine-54 N-methylase